MHTQQLHCRGTHSLSHTHSLSLFHFTEREQSCTYFDISLTCSVATLKPLANVVTCASGAADTASLYACKSKKKRWNAGDGGREMHNVLLRQYIVG